MKWSFASAFIVGMCLIGLTILFLFGTLTINNESDYYNLKETTEAAMIDAIDIAYYRLHGELKMSQEKFVENFTRRFADSVGFGTSGYQIIFEDIVERPAKASVLIISDTGYYKVFGDTSKYDITNRIDAILEFSPNSLKGTTGGKRSGEGTEKKWVKKTMSVTYTSVPYVGAYQSDEYGNVVSRHYTNSNILLHIKNYLPDDLNECVHSDIRNVKFSHFKDPRAISTYGELQHHGENFTESFIYEGGHGNMAYWQMAETINISESNMRFFVSGQSSDNDTQNEYKYKPLNDITNSFDYLYKGCDIGNGEVKAEVADVWVAWQPLYYQCTGDNVQPKGGNYTNGHKNYEIYSKCLLPITYEVVFSYEQYE